MFLWLSNLSQGRLLEGKTSPTGFNALRSVVSEQPRRAAETAAAAPKCYLRQSMAGSAAPSAVTQAAAAVADAQGPPGLALMRLIVTEGLRPTGKLSSAVHRPSAQYATTSRPISKQAISPKSIRITMASDASDVCFLMRFFFSS